MTRVVRIARGRSIGDRERLAASLMVLAQTSGMLIEPSLPLYEVALTQGQAVAEEERALFRRADSAPLPEWVAISLGRQKELTLGVEPVAHAVARPIVDFEMPLRVWRRNFVALLKLGSLLLTSRSPEAALFSFVDWLYDEFQMKAAVLAIASVYCAPNSKRAGLLKGLRSPDRTAALTGIRNAAWDTLLVNNLWDSTNSANSENRITLLASFDRGLHAVARLMQAPEGSRASSEALIHDALASLWPESTTRKLSTAIALAYSTLDSPLRQVNRPDERKNVDALILEGEQNLLNWSPPGRAL